MPTTRRRLLLSGLGLGAALAARARANPAPRRAPRAESLFEVSLAQWSLHRALAAGELDPIDFPALARREYRIEAVEYVSTFYRARATDFAYLRELRGRAEDQGVASLLVMVDGEGALAASDGEERRRAVENHFKWLAAAAFLGCHSIRVNLNGEGTRDEQLGRSADSLRRLAERGEEYGVNVIVENHGGLSSDGSWLSAVMRAADHPRVGTLPDFGNFHLGGGEHYDRYRGVREMMPWAKAVSAKSHDFDGEGNETGTDYRRMLRVVLDAGYRGHVGIEYEGERLSEPEGIRATQSLLVRVRGELDEAR
jgi:sugar phosphate isomerase/epimerase